MTHHLSIEDADFLQSIESCQYSAERFRHREHIRLAYILLTQHGFDDALCRLKVLLLAFLAYNGADKSKYHETMTYAWFLAVRHFMYSSDSACDSERFLHENKILLNQEIMFTHYTRDLIYSEAARERFVKPNLDPIPFY